MQYLIIGLGNFGRTLAEELTDNGHEVIGIDVNEHRAEAVKERISMVYILDAVDSFALAALPLEEIDCAVVTIGQSMDISLRTVAALKELNIKKLYVRAIDQIHRSILTAMNVDKILIPESYAARVLASNIIYNNIEIK